MHADWDSPQPVVRLRPVNSPDRSPEDAVTGVLFADKPQGITSHDLVDAVRQVYGIRRVGHTGTLDPAASGLMILLLGRATKIAAFVTGFDKTYLAGIHLGVESDTGDGEGHLTPGGAIDSIGETAVQQALAGLSGAVSQRVPAYAAVRSGGRRRYELARAGAPVPEIERMITIHRAELLGYRPPVVQVRIECSSGAYIRSVAASLGATLGCGAYLSSLRRECVGHWQVDEAIALQDLCALRDSPDALGVLRPIERILEFPRFFLTDQAAADVIHGRPVTTSHLERIEGSFSTGDLVVLTDSAGRALAVGDALFTSTDSVVDNTGPLFRYRRVLN